MASARFPPNSNDFRLPSLKDLNFPYRPLQDEQQQQPPPPPSQPKRQRTLQHLPPSPYPPQYPQQQQQQQQQQPLPSSYPSVPPPPPPSHEQIHPHAVYPPYPSQYIPPRPPHPNPYTSPGPPPPPPPPSAPPPQGAWIPPHHQPLPPSPMPPPPPPQQQQHHHHHQHHQPPTPSHVAPHAPPQVAHLPSVSQPQPQPQPQTQPLQHPHHPHQQQQSFSRSAAVVPTQVDAHHACEAEDLGQAPPLRDGLMHEVVKNCSTLYSFAKNHVQFQTAISHAQPSLADLTEMSHLAFQVVRMLEEWKRNNGTQVNSIKLDNANGFTTSDDSRPPKRPWEEMSTNGAQEDPEANEDESIPDKAQTAAERDMELIRTKRATSTAGGSGVTGQPKSKYRKRSRATPPGKCHSCNIRETPEWRRGPDGARTLCNACGLHYAKLMRKKEKSNGSSEEISLEDLRASARSGDMDKNRSKTARGQQSSDSSPHADGHKQVNQQQQAHQAPSQQQQQQHHQGSFQVMSLGPESSGPDTTNQQTMSIPSHSWPTTTATSSSSAAAAAAPSIPHPSQVNASAGRYGADQFQHQSFMRTSQPVVIPQASSR